jgi:methyltransferase
VVSFQVFCLLVAAVAVQRLLELLWSKRNERRLLLRGGREHAQGQMKWMTLLHCSWLIAMPLEVLLLERTASAALSAGALALFLCGQGLRYAAVWSLGDRWCVRVLTVPGERVRIGGIYRWLRHPNYLGVAFEVAALPLVHGAWLTALVGSAANGALLAVRIAAEQHALMSDQDYAEAFGQPSAERH